jgi:hypothetical protein
VGDSIRNKLTEQRHLFSLIKEELYSAAKAQPCPACRADIEHFAEFMAVKARDVGAIDTYSSRKTHMRKLKEVDYINELTDTAMFITKIIRPLTRKMNAPEIYREVLNEDLEGNRTVRKHLLEAEKLMGRLDRKDKDYRLMHDILDSFIKVTEFKLSIDPLTFYIFDKTVRFGYKTHLLSVSSKMTVGIKELVNPSRYV